MNWRITAYTMPYALFDLDQTLHDKRATLRIFSQIVHKYYKLESQGIDVQSFQATFIAENEIIQPKDKVCEQLITKFNINTTPDAMLDFYDQNYHQHAVAFDGAKATLQQLKTMGFTLGCITNGRDHAQRNKIASLGIEGHFEVIVTSGELGIKKPDPRIFDYALGLLTASPQDCFFCGDNLKADIEPAKAMGMTTLYKSDANEKPETADYMFNTFADFMPIIDQLNF